MNKVKEFTQLQKDSSVTLDESIATSQLYVRFKDGVEARVISFVSGDTYFFGNNPTDVSPRIWARKKFTYESEDALLLLEPKLIPSASGDGYCLPPNEIIARFVAGSKILKLCYYTTDNPYVGSLKDFIEKTTLTMDFNAHCGAIDD